MPQLFSKVIRSLSRRNATLSARHSLSRAVCDTLEGRLHFSVTQNAAGFTVVTPGSQDQVVYVSTSSGNDANNGLSASSPVRTINKAKTIVRQGYGDQMLLKRGDTFYETMGQWTKSGRSTDEPMVIGAYGSGERPVVATGTASAITLGTATYKSINHLVIQGIYFYSNQRDPSNGSFTGGGGASEGLRLISGTNNLLVEDVAVRYYGTNINIMGGIAPASNIRVRRSVFADAYNANGYSQGLYAENVNGLLLEENVLDHNGWNSNVAGADSTIYNHNAYIKESVSNFVARGNVISNAASYGMQARSGGIIENNTFYNNPMQMTYGLVNGGPVTAGGVTGRITNNLFQGGGFTAGVNRGWALSLSNVKSASITGNVFTSIAANSGFAVYLNIVQNVSNVGSAVGVNNINFENNIINDWTKPFGIADQLIPGGSGATGLKNITVRNNDFQNTQKTTVLALGADYSSSQIKLSGNRYHSNAGTPVVNLGTSAQSWAQWAPGRDFGSSVTKVAYAGGYRTLGSYSSSIGQGSGDSFISAAKKQSSSNWRSELVGSLPANFVRSGYGLVGTVEPTPVPPPPPPPEPTPVPPVSPPPPVTDPVEEEPSTVPPPPPPPVEDPTTVPPPPPPPTTEPEQPGSINPLVKAVLRPTEDTYVRNGSYAGLNYGASKLLDVRMSSVSGNSRLTYLKFNLSGVGAISTATLTMRGRALDVGSMDMAVAASNSENWSENSINWNNQPGAAATIANFNKKVSGSTAIDYSANLGTWLAARKAAGDTSVTLVVMSPVVATTAGQFSSDEAYMYQPTLIINEGATGSTGGTSPPPVSVPPLTTTPATILRATEDTYVRDGSYASKNYGSASTLEVRDSVVSGNSRLTYLKFDISSVSDISDATLYINGKAVQSGSVEMTVTEAASNWSEGSMTWNSRAALLGAPIATFSPIVTGTSAKNYSATFGQWLAAKKAAGESIVSLAVSSPVAGTTAGSFSSSEAAASTPFLSIN